MQYINTCSTCDQCVIDQKMFYTNQNDDPYCSEQCIQDIHSETLKIWQSQE